MVFFFSFNLKSLDLLLGILSIIYLTDKILEGFCVELPERKLFAWLEEVDIDENVDDEDDDGGDYGENDTVFFENDWRSGGVFLAWSSRFFATGWFFWLHLFNDKIFRLRLQRVKQADGIGIF